MVVVGEPVAGKIDFIIQYKKCNSNFFIFIYLVYIKNFN